MRYEAARQRVEALERVVVERPAVITEGYEQLVRAVGLVLLIPGSMLVLIGLFIIPFGVGAPGVVLACSFLHVLLLLGMLSLINVLEKPATRLLVWGFWPAHRWWLVHHAPHAVSMRVLREHQWHHAPSSVDFDALEGVLTAGHQAPLDLSKPFDISLSRSEAPTPQLRIRFSSPRTGRATVICAELPLDVIWRWGERWRTLPRIDGESVVMPWKDLEGLIRALRPFGDACGVVWPPMLSAMRGHQRP